VNVKEASRTLLVLGGTSDIGRATALAFARDGWAIQLAGRNVVALRREAEDIATRAQVSVSTHHFDVLETASFDAFVSGLPVMPHTVLCVIGVLGDQHRAQGDMDYASFVMRTNYEGPALILGLFAERFAARGFGTIIGVSSVAGDRGRGSNYVYGSAKAGFTAFLSGLRNRLCKQNVHIVTVKPGFVATRMTEGLKLPRILTSRPETLGKLIYANRGKDNVYSNTIWRVLMLVIRTLPEALFKRTTL
jgi:NAD(P)-dependent dehydrogenase (short-subunit alcohol dehydrogenase family)